MTHAALLHYFPSKEALLVEVLRERDARGAGAEASPPGLPSLVRGAEYNATVPGLIALYTSMAATAADAGNDEARAYFTERFAQLRARIADALAQDAGEPVGAEHLGLASLIIAASDGLQIQWLLDDSVDIAAGLGLLQKLIERS